MTTEYGNLKYNFFSFNNDMEDDLTAANWVSDQVDIFNHMTAHAPVRGWKSCRFNIGRYFGGLQMTLEIRAKKNAAWFASREFQYNSNEFSLFFDRIYATPGAMTFKDNNVFNAVAISHRGTLTSADLRYMAALLNHVKKEIRELPDIMAEYGFERISHNKWKYPGVQDVCFMQDVDFRTEGNMDLSDYVYKDHQLHEWLSRGHALLAVFPMRLSGRPVRWDEKKVSVKGFHLREMAVGFFKGLLEMPRYKSSLWTSFNESLRRDLVEGVQRREMDAPLLRKPRENVFLWSSDEAWPTHFSHEMPR